MNRLRSAHALLSTAIVAVIATIAVVAVAAMSSAATTPPGVLATTPPTPTGTEPVPTPEPTDEVCAIPDPTSTTASPPVGPEYAPVAYRVRADDPLDATWVVGLTLFKTPRAPKVGDTVRFTIELIVPGALDTLVDLAKKCNGGKKTGKITALCKVTSVDRGLDALTVTCTVQSIEAEIGGKKVKVPLPNPPPQITVGIAITP